MLFNIQYNLNYSYFRKIKRPSVLLDFHYNQQFNYNIQNNIPKGYIKTDKILTDKTDKIKQT